MSKIFEEYNPMEHEHIIYENDYDYYYDISETKDKVNFSDAGMWHMKSIEMEHLSNYIDDEITEERIRDNVSADGLCNVHQLFLHCTDESCKEVTVFTNHENKNPVVRLNVSNVDGYYESVNEFGIENRISKIMSYMNKEDYSNLKIFLYGLRWNIKRLLRLSDAMHLDKVIDR